MAYLTVRDLSLGYDSHEIAGGLNFTVEPGDYLCVVGENGSGKTTLMKTLLHLRAPIGGEIRIGDGLLPNEIGYLPQQTVVQKDFPAAPRAWGCVRFSRKKKSAAPRKRWSGWALRRLRGVAIGTFRADSSSAFCSRGRFARRARSCCSTNPFPGWIRS